MYYFILFFLVSDGYEGLPSEAPFDTIHVGATAQEIPKALEDQLKVGGRLVIPVGEAYILGTKKENGEVVYQKVLNVVFVPLVHGIA